MKKKDFENLCIKKAANGQLSAAIAISCLDQIIWDNIFEYSNVVGIFDDMEPIIRQNREAAFLQAKFIRSAIKNGWSGNIIQSFADVFVGTLQDIVEIDIAVKKIKEGDIYLPNGWAFASWQRAGHCVIPILSRNASIEEIAANPMLATYAGKPMAKRLFEKCSGFIRKELPFCQFPIKTGMSDMPILHSSSFCGQEWVIRKQVEMCPDSDEFDEQGWLPLHYAVLNPDLGAVLALINSGCKHEADSDGLTPTALATTLEKEQATISALEFYAMKSRHQKNEPINRKTI